MSADTSAIKHYRKRGTHPMRPYVPGENMTGISIGQGVIPKEGGFIAHSAANPHDKWYVSPEYHAEHYEHHDGQNATAPKIEIKHRYTGAVLYTNETTDDRISNGLALRDAMEKASACGADLRGADLGGAYLGGADLGGAYLGGAYLRGADLRGAYLRGADLRGAQARAAYLGAAYLGGAYLGGADLGGADLGGAYLRGADLGGADLRGADLGGAYLGAAYLGGADLRGAGLGGAYLGGADLGGGLLLVGERPLLQIGPIGSRFALLSVWLTNLGARLQTGCFFGTFDEFENAVDAEHGDSNHGHEYRAAIALAKVHVSQWAPAVSADPATSQEAAQ